MSNSSQEGLQGSLDNTTAFLSQIGGFLPNFLGPVNPAAPPLHLTFPLGSLPSADITPSSNAGRPRPPPLSILPHNNNSSNNNNAILTAPPQYISHFNHHLGQPPQQHYPTTAINPTSFSSNFFHVNSPYSSNPATASISSSSSSTRPNVDQQQQQHHHHHQWPASAISIPTSLNSPFSPSNPVTAVDTSTSAYTASTLAKTIGSTIPSASHPVHNHFLLNSPPFTAATTTTAISSSQPLLSMPFLSTALQPSLLPSETFGNINPDNFFSHTQFGDSAIVRNPLGIGSTLISPDLLSNGGQGGLSSTHDLYGNSKPNCSQANPAILDPSVKSGHVFDFQPTFIQPLPILIGPTNTTTNVPAASSVAVATSALFSPNVSAESATTKTPVAFAATTSTDTFNKVTSSADSRSEPALCLSSVSAISIPTDTTLTYEPSSVSATMEEPLSATIGLGTTPFTVNARNQSVNPQSNGNKDHDGNFGTAISGCSQSLGSPLPAFSAPPPSSSSSSSTNPSQSPAILSPQPTPLPSNRNVPAVNTCHSLSKHSAIDGRQCETPANRGPIESSGTTSNTPTLSTIAATAGGVAITSQDASLGADSHMSPQPAHMFCMISHKGNFFTIQGNCFELLGYTSSELLTMKVQEILHPDDVAAFKCFLEALLRAKQPCCSYRFVRKDNSIARLKLAMCCNLLPVQQDISPSPSSPTSSLLPSFEENQGNDILGQSHQATGRSEPSGISAIQSLQEMYASALSNYSRSACSVNLDEYAKASDGAAKPARLPTFLIVATLDELQRQQHPQSSASSSPEQPLYQIVQSAASLGLQNLGVGTAPVLSASVVAKSTIRSGGSSNSDQITKILQKPKKRRGDRASKERDDSGGEPCPKPATPGADVLDGPGKDSMAKPRKRKKARPSEDRVCSDCGARESPEWRKGPGGPKTLCNACGLRWAKRNKKPDTSPRNIDLLQHRPHTPHHQQQHSSHPHILHTNNGPNP